MLLAAQRLRFAQEREAGFAPNNKLHRQEYSVGSVRDRFEYLNVDTIGTEGCVLRRVQYMYYDRSFADLMLREMLLTRNFRARKQRYVLVCCDLETQVYFTVSIASCRAEVRSTWPRLHIAAQESFNEMSTLLPAHARHRHPLLEDLSNSLAFNYQLARMYAELEDQVEWLYLSLDATLKVCMKLKGQESHRATEALRSAAPFGDDTAWRRLLTVRGRSGAVLLMTPLPSAASEHVVSALREAFSDAQLGMVQYVASDMPSPKFYAELREICPNLRAPCVDAIHLAIVYEYAQSNKKQPGQSYCVKFFAKLWQLSIDFGSVGAVLHG